MSLSYPYCFVTIGYFPSLKFLSFKLVANDMSITDVLCSDDFWYPASVNASQIKERLCSANFTAIQKELEDMIYWNVFLYKVD